MKKYSANKFCSVMIFIFILLLSACADPIYSIVGTYEYEDVIIADLSPEGRDYLREHKAGTEYIIEPSAFAVVQADNEDKYTNISYKKEVLDDKIIEDRYDCLKEMFDKYKERYRYSLYDEQGEKIRYHIFQLDEDVYICRYDRSDMLFHWFDKVRKKA